MERRLGLTREKVALERHLGLKTTFEVALELRLGLKTTFEVALERRLELKRRKGSLGTAFWCPGRRRGWEHPTEARNAKAP